MAQNPARKGMREDKEKGMSGEESKMGEDGREGKEKRKEGKRREEKREKRYLVQINQCNPIHSQIKVSCGQTRLPGHQEQQLGICRSLS